MNYYNEYDKKAAAWLRELINVGAIAPGIVDERSIKDVRPADLRGFTQCHFFAGIGVWSYALRRAGWPDSRPVWTGSCPCQPFSNAGRGDGVADERHLWPHFFQLIAQCRPADVLGEQVASKDGLAWLDLVHSDMEAAGYAFGAADLCAAGVGAPHIRQRLFFAAKSLADAHHQPLQLGDGRRGREGVGSPRDGGDGPGRVGADGSVADTERPGLQVRADRDIRGAVGHDEGRLAVESGDGGVRVVGNAPSGGCGELGHALGTGRGRHADGTGQPGVVGDTDGQRLAAAPEHGLRAHAGPDAQPHGGAGGLADASDSGSQERQGDVDFGGERPAVWGREQQFPGVGAASGTGGWPDPFGASGARHGHDAGTPGHPGGLADADGGGPARISGRGGREGQVGIDLGAQAGRPGPTNGHWASPDWIYCRDGKWRPVSPEPQPLVDGSAEGLGRVRSEVVAQVEEEVNALAMGCQVEPAEAVRNLWAYLRAEAPRLWPARGLPGLHEAPFLLAFMRQLAEQGWGVAQCVLVSCEEATAPSLRGVRNDIKPTGAPHQRGLEGQPTRERPDLVPLLSSLLARHAQEAWADTYKTYAEIGFPLTHNGAARVGRLRGYGNAIVAQVAETFIASYLDIEGVIA